MATEKQPPSRQGVLAVLPGLALAGLVMIAAHFASGWLGARVLELQGIDPTGRSSPISGIMVAIVIGIIVANAVRLPSWMGAGFAFGTKRVLRLGIILVGIRLSFLDVVKLGAWGIPVVFTVIAVALVLATFLGRRLGVSDRLSTLAAASTAICGVTATVAVAPTIDADDKEVAYTIANVTLFGIVAMFAYPYLAHALFPSVPGAAGMFLGTSIHETAQVMGAALSYREMFHDEVAMKTATVTKLTRNVFLVAVVPALAWMHRRRTGAAAKGPAKLTQLFPLFVLGFLLMAIVRSTGDLGARGGAAFGIWSPAEWKDVTTVIGDRVAYGALGVAMACVGLGTRLSTFRGLGLRPIWLGALTSALVGATALGLAAAVGRFVGT
jgi:uncharacterized integral membrane protein (TIGR00698 family)